MRNFQGEIKKISYSISEDPSVFIMCLGKMMFNQRLMSYNIFSSASFTNGHSLIFHLRLYFICCFLNKNEESMVTVTMVNKSKTKYVKK